jgi:hypothetical protein
MCDKSGVQHFYLDRIMLRLRVVCEINHIFCLYVIFVHLWVKTVISLQLTVEILRLLASVYRIGIRLESLFICIFCLFHFYIMFIFIF